MTNTPNAQRPFHDVLSEAVQARDLTLERLSARLKALGTPVSIATLSYWQSGRSLPTRARSIKALEHLEAILQLSPGHLVSALPGDSFTRWDPLAVLPPQERIQAIVAEMGMDLNRHLTTLSMMDSVTVSPDGLSNEQVTRQLLRAEEDHLEHTPIVLSQAPLTGGGGAPGLRAGLGCTLGQMAVDDDAGFVVAEMRFPRPLQRGDMALVEYVALWESDQVETSFDRSLAAGARFLVMEATFEGKAPVEAAYWYTPSHQRADEERSQIVHPGRHIQVALRDVPAGIHRLAWQLPDEAPES